MFRNDKLANAVRLAMMFGAVSTAALSTSVMAAEEEEDQAKKVERIEVTGSRIKRTDMEGALPVSTIDRADIDMSGQISVSDLLRGTTFNSTGSQRPTSGSSQQGVSTINLRGLGADRTLILVDGRRLPKSPSSGAVQDLNTIPIGAVERVEILSDGASALYGSDAMGGVVNIITRKDFNGAELTVGAGTPSVPQEGGDRENGSFTFGSSSGTTSLLGGVSWNSQDIVFERHYPWTLTGASRFGNNWEDIKSGALSGIPNGCDEPGFVKNANGTCGYNFNAVNATEASTKNKSLFIKANHQINDEWSIYLNSSAAKTDSFGRYAPVPDAFQISKDSVNNPTNPNAWFYDAKNPKRVAYNAATMGAQRDVILNHRFAALGPRDGYTTNDSTDFLAGSSAQLEGVDIDFGVRRTTSKSYDIGYNYVVRNTAQMYLENGTYNIQEPSKNSADILGAMTATIARVSTSDQDEAYANASFDMFEVAAGMVQGVFGAEYRKEDFSDRYDSLSENGQIGGSAGNSAGGDRSIKSAFFESLVPVLDNLELSFAGRYDKYSDYGSDFAPKVSTKWIPMEDMVVRASWGQGFRAPTLDILTAKTTYAAANVTDKPTCSLIGADTCQVDTYIQSNPNLQSEQSDQYSFGWAWQPMDWINFSVDYWNIKIENKITYFSPGTLIARIQANDPVPAGLGIIRKQNGAIDRVNAGYGNEGVINSDGVDINVQTNFDFGDFGRLNQNLQIGRTLNLDEGGRNFVRDPAIPAHRVTLQNIYSYGDFDFGYNLNLIGNQFRCGFGTASTANATRNGCGTSAGAPRSGNWGTYVTHDMQVTYSTPWQGKVTVGALNMFEKLPSLRPYDNQQYNYDLYDGWGRVAYVRYSQSF
jgi:iron complex outermembrane receptor protein